MLAPTTQTAAATTTQTAADAIAFETFAVAKGKGITATDRLNQALKNGAEVGALLANGRHKKAVIAAIAAQGTEKTIHDLASGNIRPAYAAVVDIAGKAESMLTEGGKAPYSEWLRLGATLKGRKQITASGKPTAASKALALWERYTAEAAAIRAARVASISA